ncbi:dimethylaniline monooxygenase [Moniliophthora roreri]|nr:dimethylaniline monooxygenase [Moniliophthora roreri]
MVAARSLYYPRRYKKLLRTDWDIKAYIPPWTSNEEPKPSYVSQHTSGPDFFLRNIMPLCLCPSLPASRFI